MTSPAPNQDFFDRLEQEGNDEMRLLDELGPGHFGTEHLIDMHRDLRNRIAFFLRKQRLVFTLIGSVAGWVALIGVARFTGYRWLALTAYCFLTLSFFALLFVLMTASRRYLSKGHLEYDLRLIESELRKRGVRPVEQGAGRKS